VDIEAYTVLIVSERIVRMADAPQSAGIRFSDRASQEMGQLAKNLDRLQEIIDASEEIRFAAEPEKPLRQLSSVVGIPYRELKSVFNALENLKGLADHLGSIEEAIEKISASIDAETGKEVLLQAVELRDALTKYAADNPISISFKAQRLTFQRDKLFQTADILTDARPVFNSTGDKIIEFIVTHELVITWTSSSDSVTKHISLDNADLLILRRACDKAFLKSKSVRDALQDSFYTEVVRDASE
jgi:hypothetical protein